jgi:hypothetical protein
MSALLKPIVFHLDNGKRQLIKNPQFIVTKVMVAAVDDKGLPVLMTPESIVDIKYFRRKKRLRRSVPPPSDELDKSALRKILSRPSLLFQPNQHIYMPL